MQAEGHEEHGKNHLADEDAERKANRRRNDEYQPANQLRCSNPVLQCTKNILFLILFSQISAKIPQQMNAITPEFIDQTDTRMAADEILALPQSRFAFPQADTVL